jgi:polysaccharide export outer membrane protein
MTRLVAGLALLWTACGVHYNYDYKSEPDPRRLEYVIGVADQLSIQVWKNPELSRDVTVRPDGTITLPLVGDLTANGKTPSELKDEITRQLSKYLRGEGADVTVAVSSVNSYSFTVSGNVERPGVFTAQKYVTVLEAVQLAGGPNRFASPKKTKLFRRGGRDGKPRVIPIDYPSIVDGSRPEADLALFAGDQIYVP